MSTSLRDQLLKAGLVDKQQVNEVERLQQRQERQERRPQHKRAHQSAPRPAAPGNSLATPKASASAKARPAPGPASPPKPVPVQNAAALQALSARMARDQALNRRKQEKAEKKARLAQIKQLIERHRLPSLEQGETFNFVDGNKIRRIFIDASMRQQLASGAIVIVRHEARYDLVPAATAARIRERDEHSVVRVKAAGEDVSSGEARPAEDAYAGFVVPDDLIW